MDAINLKDILNGKLTKLPFELECVERHEFALALADALATLHQTEFPDVNELDHTRISAGEFVSEPMPSEEVLLRHAEFGVITDNFILFFMDEANGFTPENVIAAFVRAIRTHRVAFTENSDAFTAFYRKHHMWIVGGSYSELQSVKPASPKLSDKQTEKAQAVSKEINKRIEPKQTFGGNFTLRDHHKNQ